MRISDWSSDVCSSDLGNPPSRASAAQGPAGHHVARAGRIPTPDAGEHAMNASKGNVREPQRIPAQRKLCAALIIALVACDTPAWAQSDEAPPAYSIPAGNLDDGLEPPAATPKENLIYHAELGEHRKREW